MSAARRLALPEVRESITRFGPMFTRDGGVIPGGLDLVTPTLSVQSGCVQEGSVNFEVNQSGGYSRIVGYERSDGQASPSDAIYRIVQVSAFTNVPAVGDDIKQTGTGATGVVADVVNGPTYFYMVVTKVTGTFNYTGAINGVGALHITAANAPYRVKDHSPPIHLPILTAIGTAITPTFAVTSLQDAQYTAAAADVYREDIEPPPGGGNTLGILAMTVSGSDEVYAWRATEDESSVRIYKQTTSGWVLVPLYNIIEFTTGGGGSEPSDGETLTQGGRTATLLRVMTRSGDLWAGSAAGAFVIGTPVGGSFVAGAATLSGGGTVTLSGSQSAITIAPGGRYQFTVCNFSGAVATRAAYGCDGVNKGFEFRNEIYSPITTGLDIDVPSNVTNHKNHLFFSYDSGINHSAPGLPFNWTASAGAGAIATGDVVTGMITLPTGADTATMAVYQRANTSFLYGTGLSDWNFVAFNVGVGAIQYTVQSLFDSFFFGDTGTVQLKATLNWGNFQPEVLTRNIQPFIDRERTRVAASLINRTKNQYRVFFEDGYGLWGTILNQRYLGSMPVQFPNAVFVTAQATTVNGGEVSYFASSDGGGYVYQMEKGTSFDGLPITASIVTVWDAQRSSLMMKRYRALSLEVAGNAYAALNFGYKLGYGARTINQPTPVAYDTNFSPPPAWDSFTWDAFVWDGVTLVPTYVQMLGDGQNVSATLSSATTYIAAYSLNSATFQYTPRRQMRI